MAKQLKQIYQFKVALQYCEKPVWRRILVPENYSFWDLHVAIQDAMGWYDCHLHEFEMIDPKFGERVVIGSPNEEFDDVPVIAETKSRIKNYFTHSNKVST